MPYIYYVINSYIELHVSDCVEDEHTIYPLYDGAIVWIISVMHVVCYLYLYLLFWFWFLLSLGLRL